jgi:putative ATP-binding cassette transporter
VIGTYRDDYIRVALVDARLGGLVGELDHEDVWSRPSSGEQQRLVLARALLSNPTGFARRIHVGDGGDAGRRALCDLGQRLPHTTIISFGHCSTLAGLHHRHLEMTAEGDHVTPRDANQSPGYRRKFKFKVGLELPKSSTQ